MPVLCVGYSSTSDEATERAVAGGQHRDTPHQWIGQVLVGLGVGVGVTWTRWARRRAFATSRSCPPGGFVVGWTIFLRARIGLIGSVLLLLTPRTARFAQSSRLNYGGTRGRKVPAAIGVPREGSRSDGSGFEDTAGHCR